MGGRVAGMTRSASRKILTRGTLPLLLAAFLVVLAFALGFHHHDDAAVHPDCSFCTAVHQAQSTSLQHQETGTPAIVQALLELPPSPPAPVILHLEVPVIRPPPV
jgi:hypothetical protein